MKYLYSIIIALLIVIGFLVFRPKQVDPTISILRQQTIKDSLRIESLIKGVDSLDSVIYQNEKKVAELTISNANLAIKYNKERYKLKGLSQSDAIESFVSQTGGRLDSIYSIPRMNLLYALEIFVDAQELTLVNRNLNSIVMTQDSIIADQGEQVIGLREAYAILNNSLELHKSALSLQEQENSRLEKKLKRKKITQTITTVIAGAGLIYFVVR